MILNRGELLNLPRIIQGTMHRKLESINLKIIFKGAGGWSLFFAFLQCTKLPCNQVSMILHGDINWERQSLVRSVDRVGRSWEMQPSKNLFDQIPKGLSASEPLFPSLYCDFDDPEHRELRLNENLATPNEFLGALLASENRPLASLMSFRLTPSTTLPEVGTQMVN